MKKLISIIVTVAIVVAMIPVAIFLINNNEEEAPYLATKHLILNSDGSYGGSYNEALYGKGAPLNGEYDVENSDYYFNGDYYNNGGYPGAPMGYPVYQQSNNNSSLWSIILIIFILFIIKSYKNDY